jgi:hypothetical protein
MVAPALTGSWTTGRCARNAWGGKLRRHGASGPVTDDTVEFSATQQDAGDGAPGATAAFPYDRMTVECFRRYSRAHGGATTWVPGSCRARGRNNT